MRKHNNILLLNILIRGAIQVLRNAIFLEIGTPPTPLVTLITLNITPFFPENQTPPPPICVT